jgi:hypothetical protein
VKFTKFTAARVFSERGFWGGASLAEGHTKVTPAAGILDLRGGAANGEGGMALLIRIEAHAASVRRRAAIGQGFLFGLPCRTFGAALGSTAKGLRMTNKLFYGDNLDVLREHIASESVDLVYLDPPFNSNANYNILFQSPKKSVNILKCKHKFRRLRYLEME